MSIPPVATHLLDLSNNLQQQILHSQQAPSLPFSLSTNSTEATGLQLGKTRSGQTEMAASMKALQLKNEANSVRSKSTNLTAAAMNTSILKLSALLSMNFNICYFSSPSKSNAYNLFDETPTRILHSLSTQQTQQAILPYN